MPNTDVLIGALVCRRTAYVLDLFLANQREVQQIYPGCRLILATEEPDYVAELKTLLGKYNLNGEIILFEVNKPDYARSRVWAIGCGREKLRQFAISRPADYMLFLDTDLTCDPQIINILKSRIRGFNAAFAGFRLRHDGSWGFGGGCFMLDRKALSQITIRCVEFRNGEVICEDEIIDMELFKNHCRANKGLFLANRHYRSREVFFDIAPGPVSFFRRTANSLPVRYMLIKMSILCRRNIEGWLHNKLIRK